MEIIWIVLIVLASNIIVGYIGNRLTWARTKREKQEEFELFMHTIEENLKVHDTVKSIKLLVEQDELSMVALMSASLWFRIAPNVPDELKQIVETAIYANSEERSVGWPQVLMQVLVGNAQDVDTQDDAQDMSSWLSHCSSGFSSDSDGRPSDTEESEPTSAPAVAQDSSES